MEALIQLKKHFEGQNLTTIRYKGKPCWIAKEVGQILGYADGGKRLVDRLSSDWSDEFIYDHDYIRIKGEELKIFKALMEDTPESGVSYTSRLILFFEPGLHLVLAKTSKPVGKRLRRFLADEVLPQLARDGSYLPEREVKDGQLKFRESAADNRLELAIAREQRLLAKEQRMRRQMEQRAILSLVDSLRSRKDIEGDVVSAYEVVAAEKATGDDYSPLKPKCEGDDWLSPTRIAQRFGQTVYRIGLVISRLGLRGNQPGLAKAIVNKAQGHQKTVTSYLYSPKAVDRIATELRAQGLIAEPAA